MKTVSFFLDYVNLLYYKRLINPNCGGPCIDSLDWIKKIKKRTIIPFNKKR